MTTKTDPNKDYTIKEFYIKVKGDYGSMGVTDEEVSTTHRRKDLDLL